MNYYYKDIKGKKKRISQAQYISENFNEIEPEKLDKKGQQIFSAIAFEIEQANERERKRLEKNAKISAKAKARLRNPNGSFLTAEDKRRITQVIEDKSLINPNTGKRYRINELTQEQLTDIYNLPVFFTLNSMSISERINDNKMTVYVDGQEMTKEQAIEAINMATNANFQEWTQKISKRIYGFIYKCEWYPSKRELFIDTFIYDESQVLKSDKENGTEKKKGKTAK